MSIGSLAITRYTPLGSQFSQRVGGDRPRGDQVDIIADMLLLDYDLVSTKAEYRPRGLLEIDADSSTLCLMPLIERVDWDAYSSRFDTLEKELMWMIEKDRDAESGKE